MDGNGRWAEAHGKSVDEGHRAGARALRRTVEAAIDLGIETLVVYAFSTENWTRPSGEVADLMVLLSETIDEELPDLAKQGVRTRFLGRRDRIDPAIQEQMSALEDETATLDTLSLWIAFDYGGRAEIVDAARRLIAAGVGESQLDEKRFSDFLYTAGQPDPDLLIRTSGEMRVSNFLLWQIAYAEIWVTDTLWPDFRARHLLEAILAYQKRERRYGGITPPRVAIGQ